MTTELAPTTDHDALPEPVQALAPHLRRAWEVRAAGGRWRDAAKAAGVEVGTLWRQAQHHIPFRDALRLAYLEHDDAHRDVIARTLADGTAPEATDKDKDRALRAAVHVSRGLGIVSSGIGAAPAHAPTSVSVTVAVGLLGGAGTPPSVDVPGVVVDARTVEASQPRRSRSSSRRPTRSGSSASD